MKLSDGRLIFRATDLVAFTECLHQTRLNRDTAQGLRNRPTAADPFAELLSTRGREHEAAHLQRLRGSGGRVVEIHTEAAQPYGEAFFRAEAATLAAMRDGPEIIAQASFFDGRWQGRADFLHRVPAPSDLGNWSYEVHETKLSRHPTPGALLQLCEYSQHVERLQGLAPRQVHVVLGSGETATFRLADFAAYHRAVRERFEAAVEADVMDTYPEPVQHCGMCAWQTSCKSQWRNDDHLSLVAGMRRDQRVKLGAVGVSNRIALAHSSVDLVVPRMHPPAFVRLREQARLQVERDLGRDVRRDGDARIPWELLPWDGSPHRGLAGLPEPSDGDVFFDMEGDPLLPPDGLEYLFGWTTVDTGTPMFDCRWAHDAAAEKAAFEGFIDVVMERRRRWPGAHIYHYAPYEPAAIKKLMGRHATREAEVDQLLRSGALVDLYAVVRQGVQIGVESYSIKKLEPLYQDGRSGLVQDAANSVVQYERWLTIGDQRLLDEIRDYNRDDCDSLVGLRRWLEARRVDLAVRLGDVIPRPPLEDGLPSESMASATTAVEQIATDLRASIPEDAAARTDEQGATWLLAALLDWHRRESRPEWWAHFARLRMSDEELVEDSDAIGLLCYQSIVGMEKRSAVHRFTFDSSQEYKLGPGDDGFDPRTEARVGTITEVSRSEGWIDLKRQPPLGDLAPTALVPDRPIGAGVLQTALQRVGEWVRDHGIDADGPYRAARDLLLRRRPRRALDGDGDGDGGVGGGVARRGGGPLRTADETASEAVRRLVVSLREGCLAVQGPPGTGKTFTGAHAVIELVRHGRGPVAITALSHRAIGNFLATLMQVAAAEGTTLRVVQKADADEACQAEGIRYASEPRKVEAAVAAGEVDVVAGTAWLFAREALAGRFDTLVVDEAGQLSLANVVAISGCASNLVLLGDPQQLEQPVKGLHPEGARASALEHLLGGAATIAEDRGLFLDVTWRMHPALCAFVSDGYYDGRLTARPECSVQAICGAAPMDGDPVGGAGLRWIAVEHSGNRSQSGEEAAVVAELVGELLGRSWTDGVGRTRPLTVADILVVAPYNAHVARLRSALPQAARIGTVDKFQGQEGAVVIYSMATSLAEDVPRGMEFLFSGNRLNVAISRARALAIVVCSPRLLEAACQTVEQMRLANGLCRLRPYAVPAPDRFQASMQR